MTRRLFAGFAPQWMLAALIAPTLLAASAAAAPPATAPTVTKKLAHIEVDVKHKQVRVECKACQPDYGLEFFVCADNSNEYESVLHTAAKPSEIHLALLMLGLEPGEPVRYDEKLNKYFPPHGPPLKLSCEFESKGKTVTVPASRMLRDAATKKEAPPITWVFAGSRILDDHSYAADGSGSIVAILNSDLSVITLPKLAGTALEGREYVYNPDVVPPAGTTVWLIIEPAGPLKEAPADSKTSPASAPATQP